MGMALFACGILLDAYQVRLHSNNLKYILFAVSAVLAAWLVSVIIFRVVSTVNKIFEDRLFNYAVKHNHTAEARLVKQSYQLKDTADKVYKMTIATYEYIYRGRKYKRSYRLYDPPNSMPLYFVLKPSKARMKYKIAYFEFSGEVFIITLIAISIALYVFYKQNTYV